MRPIQEEMERTGKTYEEVLDDRASAADAEHDRRRDDALLERWAQKDLQPPAGYTADELERDNPYNQWMYEQ